MTWMQTAGGRAVDLLDPKPEQIHLDDIVHHLCRLARWTGATKGERIYSVGEHSMGTFWVGMELARRDGNVRYLMPELEHLPQHLLLHEAHEAYTGDLSSPMKQCLPGIREIQDRLQRVIEVALHLPPPTEAELAIVKLADEMMLRLERDKLMPKCEREWSFEPRQPPIDVKLHCWPVPFIERVFRSALRTYGVGEAT